MSAIRCIPNVPSEIEEQIEKENSSIQRAIWENNYENIRRKREPRKFEHVMLEEISEAEDETEVDDQTLDN